MENANAILAISASLGLSAEQLVERSLHRFAGRLPSELTRDQGAELIRELQRVAVRPGNGG